MKFSSKLQILFLWLLGIICNIITFFIIYIKISSGQNQFALKYNIISGVEWRGSGINFYLFPVIGLVVMAMNFALAKFLEKYRIVFLKELSAFTTLTFQFVLLLATVFLMKIN